MAGAPEKMVGEDGLPLPPYALYNIGNSHPENLLDFVDILHLRIGGRDHAAKSKHGDCGGNE